MDVVVTVPKGLWAEWILEGDLPGEDWSGREYVYWTSGARPGIEPDERVYIVAHGKLRGYAPLVALEVTNKYQVRFIRNTGAVAVTITPAIAGFRGWRYRWWPREDERPFPGWRTP
jgi:hypothetical protein